MLVVLSDLHLSEDTYLGDRNPDPKALRLFLSQMARTALEKKAKEIIIVLNGDIFDHIRSERWLNADKDGLTYKPYAPVDVSKGGIFPKEIDEKAWEIHQAIENDPKVRPTIDLLKAVARGEDDIFQNTPRPRFLFIPGTSDRPANLSPRINKRIREILNLQPQKPGHGEENSAKKTDESSVELKGSLTPFPNCLIFAEGLPDDYPRAEDELGLDPGSLDYALLVQHGHEYDWLSCEFNLDDNVLSRTPGPSDRHLYAMSPISDWIAIDLIMRLARDFLEECGGDSNALIPRNQAIYRCLLDAQDVRPQLRVLQYLMWRLEGGPWEQVRHLVRNILKEALNHHHLKNWLNSHDRPWLPDRADKIGAALGAFRRMGGAMPDSFLASMAQKVSRRTTPDKAPVELIRKDPIWRCDEIHMLCHGHFHDPSNYNLAVVDGNPKVAVGTGTWRRNHRLCLDELSHLTDRSMNYCLFYRPEEQAKEVGYRMEFWRGKSISQDPTEMGTALDDPDYDYSQEDSTKDKFPQNADAEKHNPSDSASQVDATQDDNTQVDAPHDKQEPKSSEGG